VAIREGGQWVANVGQGTVRIIKEKASAAEVSSMLIVELGPSEKEERGLLGRWGVVTYPTMEGVMFR
jgi:hypothetical protein